MNLQRFAILTISLSLSLAGAHRVALAQESVTPGISTNANGDCVTYGSPGDWTITCGDLGPGSGLMVVSPPVAVDTVPATTEVSPAPAPAPAAEPAPAPAAEPVPAPDTEAAPVADSAPETTETAVATATDRDADNYADALEPEAGLDPTAADTDADHLADGDELNLYSTNPTLADTDGDGALDGEELFGRHTNPLLWDNASTTGSEPAARSEPVGDPAPAAETSTVAETTEPVAADTAISDKEAAYAAGNTVAPLPEGTTENLSATSGGAASMGTGDASAVPGTVTRDGQTTPSLPESASGVTEAPPAMNTTENEPPVVSVSGETTGVSVVPAPGLEPVATEPVEPAETIEPVPSAEPVAADTAVATATDQDADNIADAQEAEIGLDASNPDSDADGVADGDEGTLYGTDPLSGDTDGDGLSDGDELFGAGSDPLSGGANGNGVADGAADLA
jgi:hypothetical protein